jgi:hypothetical protein
MLNLNLFKHLFISNNILIGKNRKFSGGFTLFHQKISPETNYYDENSL